MEFVDLIYEKKGGIGTLSINRPNRMNAMTPDTLEELIKAVRMVGQDDEVRVLILTGIGKAFCAGADKTFLDYLSNLKNGAQFRRVLGQLVHEAVNGLERLEIPVIAAINGTAVGGGAEIALACDFRIASEEARFVFTEAKLGIIPDAGGIPRLTRLIGCGKAKEIIMTGCVVEGQEAERIGLVNKCVPHDLLPSEVNKWTARIMECAPLAVGVAKRLIDTAMDLDITSTLCMVAYAQEELFKSADTKEGIQAFFERRKPIFRGR